MSAMYAHEIGRIAALPQGAAEMVPQACGCARSTTGWPGRNGARCFATPIGPMPGPPPPWGMQKVLCRFRWQTSAPMSPGRQRPTWAFMLAPSMYTCPPCSCTIRQISLIDPSKTPCVRRIRHHQRREGVRDAPRPWLASRPGRCSPAASLLTGTTCMPAITALAGLVPWADWGMRQVVRWVSPRERW